jgi:hypothetical protein
MELWMQDLVSSRDDALLLELLLHDLVGGRLGLDELVLEPLDLVHEPVDLAVKGELLGPPLFELRIHVVHEPVAELLDGCLCGLEDIRGGDGVPGLGQRLGKQTQGLGLLTLLADVDLLGARPSLRLVLLVHFHLQLLLLIAG